LRIDRTAGWPLRMKFGVFAMLYCGQAVPCVGREGLIMQCLSMGTAPEIELLPGLRHSRAASTVRTSYFFGR
jgi:hypothetical protein